MLLSTASTVLSDLSACLLAGGPTTEDPSKNASLALPHMRVSYKIGKLDEDDAHADPMEMFRRWFADASAAGLYEPNAMCLATCTREGRPSSRMVLLKNVSDKGFSFFTNYGSRKAGELTDNPFASLTFWWGPLNRSVRIEGRVSRVSAAESDEYFASRPRDSQLGAIASKQSTVIPSREVLESEVKRLGEKYSDPSTAIPRPDWGGFIVQPDVIEFWHGRVNRLHDRLRYTLASETDTTKDKEERKESTDSRKDVHTEKPKDKAISTSRWKIDRLSP
jgi:pyridoxamine-phosphate oxidase